MIQPVSHLQISPVTTICVCLCPQIPGYTADSSDISIPSFTLAP